MKNKKLLLVATAALGVLALGTAGVGTAAWFTASSAASVTPVDNSASLVVDSSTYSAGTFYVKATAVVSEAKLDFTDYQGNCWVNSNGYLRAATMKYAKYASLTITVKFYTTSECNVEVTDVGDLANIGAKYQSVTVTLDPNDYTRLTATDPSTNFASAFSSKLNATLTVVATVSTAGAVTAYTNNPSYVSVNGDGTAEAGSAHNDGDSAGSTHTNNGAVSITCALNDRA